MKSNINKTAKGMGRVAHVLLIGLFALCVQASCTMAQILFPNPSFPVGYTNVSRPTSEVMADINGDGKPDIVTTISGSVSKRLTAQGS